METFAVTGVPPPAPVAAPAVAAEGAEPEAKAVELLPEELAEVEKPAEAELIEPDPEVRLLPAEEPAPVTEVFPLE